MSRWLGGSSDAGGPPVVFRDDAPAQAGLLVDDGATPEAHQQRRGEFLGSLRAALLATIQQALDGTPWPVPPESDIDAQLSAYQGMDAAALEQTIHREVPGTAGATTAAALVGPICARVRAEVVADLSSGTAGTVAGLARTAAGLAAQVTAAAGGLLDGIRALFKRRGAAAAGGSVPGGMERLGTGRPLDAGVRARMQGVLGGDLSGVRIHTDGSAASLAEEFDARAFTVGGHVAFGAGEYAPGTPAGDGLLAHELAHTVQQGPGTAAGPADSDAELETDADGAAAHAVGALWGRPEHTAQLFAEAAPPTRRGVLGISRCKRAPTPPPTLNHNLPDVTSPLSAPGERILFGALYGTSRPLDFEIVYTASGGATFDAPGGPTTKTIQGTAVTEQPMLLPNPWPPDARITVDFAMRRKSDGVIVATKSWTFGRKTFMPTSLLQFGELGGPDEVALPAAAGTAAAQFEYILQPGPPEGWTGTPSGPYYENYTILERFEGDSCNLQPADFDPRFASDPSLASPAAIGALFRTDSFHGSFTVNHADMIVDQHSDGGFRQVADVLRARLRTPKTVEHHRVQVYEADPGRVLARFDIIKRLYPDGHATIQKVPR